jgi:hypothetical protein
MQVEKSIQNQSVPLAFLAEPGWIQATGQASTQSATPSQVFVTIVCGIVFGCFRIDCFRIGKIGSAESARQQLPEIPFLSLIPFPGSVLAIAKLI